MGADDEPPETSEFSLDPTQQTPTVRHHSAARTCGNHPRAHRRLALEPTRPHGPPARPDTRRHPRDRAGQPVSARGATRSRRHRRGLPGDRRAARSRRRGEGLPSRHRRRHQRRPAAHRDAGAGQAAPSRIWSPCTTRNSASTPGTARAAADDADLTYLVMELVQGGTLANRITPTGMPPADVARVGAAVAGALAAVHGYGLVHRDIKPANILISTTRRREAQRLRHRAGTGGRTTDRGGRRDRHRRLPQPGTGPRRRGRPARPMSTRSAWCCWNA